MKNQIKAYAIYVPILFIAFASMAYGASFKVGIDKGNAKPMVIVDEDGDTISASNPLSVAAASGTPQPTPGTGRLVVTVAGTAEPFAVSTEIRELCVFQAFEGNTGMVAIGNSTVDAVEATRNGIVLSPLSSATLNDINLVNMWIDAEVSGEGVTIYCEF